MAIIQFKRGTTAPTGLTLGEPAWDYANNRFYIGVTSSSILINGGVSSINGLSGSVGISAGSNITISTSGNTLTISSSGGGGSGTKTYNRFTPLDNMPPGVSFATLDTRNSIPVLEFDGATFDEYAIFSNILPEAADVSSGLSINIHWMADTGTTGDVRWGTQFMGMTGNLGSDSWNTAVEKTNTTNGTSGVMNLTDITNTNLGGIIAGSPYRLRIYRKASDTGVDTMNGDAQLVFVEVRGV